MSESMSSYTIASLPPLFDVGPLSSQLSNKLPEFPPLFFVPPLEDRPQNPIVEALVGSSPSFASSLPQPAVHEEESVSTESSSDAEGLVTDGADAAADIWAAKEVITKTRAPKVRHTSHSNLWHQHFIRFRTRISPGTHYAPPLQRTLPRRRSYPNSLTMSSTPQGTSTHIMVFHYSRCLHDISPCATVFYPV